MQELYSVSIAMATYNGEQYLREQLDSLLGQEGVRLSITVRDDGSTDGTATILDEYKAKGQLDWYTGGHMGPAHGFLDLLRHVPEADYYAFSDQDDVWDADKLIVAIRALQPLSQDKPLLYYCGQRLVDAELNLLSVHRIDPRRSSHTLFLISNVAGCTAVFNQKLRELVNAKEPEFVLMHDSWIFKVCLALGGTYVADPEPHISYRQHGSNLVGIHGGMRGKMRQIMRYLHTFKIQQQMLSLRKCYAGLMTPEYQALCDAICDYDHSMSGWTRLLLSREFDFRNPMLNVVVRLKILLRLL